MNKFSYASICALFIFLLLANVHHKRFDNPTAISRQNFLHSLVVHGEWNIDRYHENTVDKAFKDSHYYSDKAPGTSFILLIPYFLTAKALEFLELDLETEESWRLLSWISAALGFGLPLSFCVYKSILALCDNIGQRGAWVLVCGLVLGGMPIVYSTVLFSHSLSFSFLVLCVLEFYSFNFNKHGTKKISSILAGIYAGLALSGEYTLGLSFIFLTGYAFSIMDRHSFIQFLFGAMFPLLLIPIYSYMTIGNVLELPYSYQASFPEMGEGLYGISEPSISLIWVLLFSPERGLFYWCPLLFLCILGICNPQWYNSKLWLLAVFIIVVNIVVISGRDFDWLAGVSFGPRYLTSALPGFFILLPEIFKRFTVLSIVLSFYSLVLTSFALYTSPVTYGDVNPIGNTMINSLVYNTVSPTILGFILGGNIAGFICSFVLTIVGSVYLYYLGKIYSKKLL